ncbi:ATP-dependent nuclease [Photobacterium sanguinicancri]|uniref:AAA family ATPase n=1 Tax=Photobacterium sanguinicancri TaxID=875932 RepID=A0AAW7Y5Y5_9GAMM|nr:AAA family ATPase [Photobacterium sanguinicancri]MDO6543691.1 AAA family ATPase [Photobacterium sanguinicancri]
MQIDKVIIKGFRNFEDTTVRFNGNSLIMGANDVGKTNLIYAIRILLDKSLSERDIEPQDTDFNIKQDGTQSNEYSITIYFKDIKEDSAKAVLKGYIDESESSVFQFIARNNGEYVFLVGANDSELEEVTGRFYLKYINLRYVKSRRDLKKFIDLEKKQLLKLAKENRSDQHSSEDNKQMQRISRGLDNINERVRRLNYVNESTTLVNDELKKLSYTNDNYSVHLDSGAIQVNQFIENLELGAKTSGSKLMLGGDGKDNQILLALWKAKSEREFDPEHHVTFYCVEEPEAHLHPHQQRKLAQYLNSDLPGQTIITTHSPQIVEQYSPDSIIRIYKNNGSSLAANDGCSNCIDEAWDNLGYRMSILPAEAFFSSCVLLVEGPSEKLFYEEVGKILNLELDYHNVSILCVDGIQFKVYAKILSALEIPWVMRTDNDVSKVPRRNEKAMVGANRCCSLLNLPPVPRFPLNTTQEDVIQQGHWARVSARINPHGLYLSKKDLENDLYDELPHQLLAYSGKTTATEAISYLQGAKALRMREFLSAYKHDLINIYQGELCKPLHHAIEKARMNI